MSAWKKNVKKLIPKTIQSNFRPLYHGLMAKYNSRKFSYPAKEISIIGVTGTKGKTTTTTLIGRLTNLLGKKTGYITTAVINLDGHNEYLNPHKMTTLDSYHIQKYLRTMVKNGCEYAIIELSSQGLHQNRHKGIGELKSGVFLNIFPEHIEYHKTFDNYLKSKALLFDNLEPNSNIIINADSPETNKLIKLLPGKSKKRAKINLVKPSKEISIETESDYTKSLTINSKKYKTHFYTNYDIENVFLAIQTIAKTVSNSTEEEEQLINKLAKLSTKLLPVAGRMEWVIKNGKPVYKKSTPTSPKRKISILVDYAHEPESMKQTMKTVNGWKPDLFQNIIHIVSCDGAGRDDWKKPILGEISYKYSDYCFLTTDNYDQNDNPEEIISLLEEKLPKKSNNTKYFKFKNRRKSFQKALELAENLKGKTLIISTGVGTEQGLTQPNGTMNWDERDVWHKEYLKIANPKLLK